MEIKENKENTTTETTATETTAVEKKEVKDKRPYTKKEKPEKTVKTKIVPTSKEDAIMHFNMDSEVLLFGLDSFVSNKDTTNGEENPGKFLKLKYKIMWCKKMYPYSYYDYEIIDQTEHSTLVTVTLYEDSSEKKVLGKGTSSISSMDLPISVEPDIMKHKRILYAIGSAASRAYTNAGFGLQFDDDVFDVIESLKAENQKIGDGIAAEEVVPEETTSTTDPEELIQNDIDYSTETENMVATQETLQLTETNVEESTTSPVPEDIEEELPFEPEEIEEEISLEDARKVVITVGKMGAAGVTVGYIAEKCPSNLIFVYRSESTPREKEAIKVIAHNNSSVMNAFKEKGFEI